jgi:hypothetical protein
MFLVMCHHSYNRGDSTSPKNSGLRAQPALGYSPSIKIVMKLQRIGHMLVVTLDFIKELNDDLRRKGLPL